MCMIASFVERRTKPRTLSFHELLILLIVTQRYDMSRDEMIIVMSAFCIHWNVVVARMPKHRLWLRHWSVQSIVLYSPWTNLYIYVRVSWECTHMTDLTDRLDIEEKYQIIQCKFVRKYPPKRVGRSRKYCNTGPTRGEVGASSCIFSQLQKWV